jgi:hypothetical protein
MHTLVRDTGPFEQSTLQELHFIVLEQVKTDFIKRAKGTAEAIDKKTNELVDCIEDDDYRGMGVGMLSLIYFRNYETSEMFCKELYREAKNKLKQELESCDSDETLLCLYQACQDEYYKSAIGPMKEWYKKQLKYQGECMIQLAVDEQLEAPKKSEEHKANRAPVGEKEKHRTWARMLAEKKQLSAWAEDLERHIKMYSKRRGFMVIPQNGLEKR